MDSYLVGALARFNLKSDKLHPKAKAAAEELGLKPICHNPYLNTVAQVVEIVHCYEHAIDLIQDLKKYGINYDEEIVVGVNEQHKIPVRAGDGVAPSRSPGASFSTTMLQIRRGLSKRPTASSQRTRTSPISNTI
jgi:coenzyme F420-reducing hydrogenase alpha subunit